MFIGTEFAQATASPSHLFKSMSEGGLRVPLTSGPGVKKGKIIILHLLQILLQQLVTWFLRRLIRE